MNKTAKALLIPVAAFAVTATGVSAFNSDILEKAGLTDDQIAAFEEARELREDGDKDGARDVLKEEGVDLAAMQSVRQALHEYKHEKHDAMHDALEADDYGAFMEAIADSPLADIITDEDDYELFKEAHELKEAGDMAAAKELFEELGFPMKDDHGFLRGMKGDETFGQYMRMGKGMPGHRGVHSEEKDS